MKDLGMMHYFLGLEVWHRTHEIFLSHGKYIVDILNKFGMLNLKPVACGYTNGDESEETKCVFFRF